MQPTTIKHSKYKNTGILFELLIRQITSDLMYSNESKAIGILKKFFTNTELSKELALYNSLLQATDLTESKANILIGTVTEQSSKLNRVKLEREKYNLIKEIKKHYDLDNFFKAKMKNYKVAAAIYTLLETVHTRGIASTEQIVTNKLTILEHVTLPIEQTVDPSIQEFVNEDREIKIVSYRLLVEKFNTRYESLSSQQKEILKEYINNVSDTEALKMFLNEKLKAVKLILEKLSKTVNNKITSIKLQEVLKNIHPISTRQSIKDDHLVSLMQYWQLVKELQSVK